jgi:diacylglycerol kinase
MRPRARDILGAVVLSAVLVALVVWIVIVASQGS